MTDEVTRLRGLRKAALKARALAEVLRTLDDRRDGILARGALLCWQVTRLCTGRLRAHPYEAFQRGPTAREIASNGLGAIVAGLAARRLGRRNNAFFTELKAVAQMLDSVRAVTLTPDLSDDLGRLQTRMGQILSELSLRAQLERGHLPQHPMRAASRTADTRSAGSQYLAL